jgi:hypothetical protein
MNSFERLSRSYATRLVLFVLIFLAIPALSWGQHREWVDKMQDHRVNFYEVQQNFKQEWDGKAEEKGKGFKAFKRWENFMEPRVYPTGERFAPDAVYRAMEEQPEMFGFNASQPGDWTYVGNTSVPGSGGGAGRINAVVNEPGSTTTWYACAPGGGLWKTTNSGTSWTVMNTDFLASIGVSDVAIDPTNVNTIYLATGDGDAGDTYSIGVLKSIDGGNTWNTTGLSFNVNQTFTMSRILIDPINPNILIVATNGGIYRTLNAGVSWTLEQSGNFKDLKFKPGDSNVVYACSDAFFRSTNNGDTWTNVTSGLPAANLISRMAIAVSPANANYVYVLAGGNDDGFYGLYRSADSGVGFTTRSATTPNILGWEPTGNDTGGQAWYDLRVEVDPANAEIVYTGGVNLWKSTNGGTSWTINSMWYTYPGVPYVHADIHAMYFLPGTTRLLIGCDGGVFSTTNGGTSYTDHSSNLQIAQIYRLGTSALNATLSITGWQDNGTNLKNNTTHTRVIGGDGMECIIDPTNSSIMYGALYYGNIRKTTTGIGGFSTIVGSGGTGVNSDGEWVTPYSLGSNPNHLFVGKNTVYRSTNGGGAFTAMGTFGSGNINAMAVAPSDNNIIYASKGGSLFKTTNGNTFAALTGLPGNFITYIFVHPTDPNKVWVTFSGFTNGVKVYVSSNGGTSWTNISGTLPNIPANCIVYQNGTNDGIYVGTDAGVFYRDSNTNVWQAYMNNLPRVVVNELEIHYGSNTLNAATYGRGQWQAPLFSLPANDLAVNAVLSPTAGNQCSAAVSPEVVLLNTGTNDITSFTLEYRVVGQAIQTLNWTGTLANGQTITLPLNAYNYGVGSFSFVAQLTSINGSPTDENTTNNQLTVDYNVIIAPANDLCAGATPIVLNAPAVTADNSSTCAEGPEPNCGGTGIRDVWYSFVYDGSAMQINTTAGTLADTRIALYSNCSTLITCNDDFGGLTSRISITCGQLTVGATYLIQAGGYDNGAGTFGLSVITLPALANDACAQAIPITTFGTPVAITNVGSCVEGTPMVCASAGQRDVWYSFVYSGGTVSISTSGGTLTDTQMAVYAACGGAAIACDDDDAAGNYSLINFGCTPGTGVAGANEAFTLVQGNTYYIQVAGFNGTTGTCNLTITVTNVSGCTNPAACNFNPCANLNSGCILATTYFQDSDGDTFGNPAVSQTACSPPAGYVTNSTDCNDSNAAVRPNATEVCNTIDDDCDTAIDEGVQTTYFRDADSDGFGTTTLTTQACSPPAGYVTNSTDCNDGNAAVRPNATEVCNTIDDDCDTAIDEGVQTTYFRDADGDGFGTTTLTTQACSPPAGYVTNSTDCNDSNAAVRPNATEVCNTIDDDCDTAIDEGVQTTYFRDADGDGFGTTALTTQACSPPAGYVTNSTDCNDAAATIYPNAPELCNGVDDDCDTTIDEGASAQNWYVDADGDGFGAGAATLSCSPIAGSVLTNTDCSPSNAAIFPGATEVCNGVDDDCDTSIDEGVATQSWYVDADGDGYGAGAATLSCSPIAGSVLTNTDCSPSNAAIFPGATEVCNGVDDDCDTTIDEGCGGGTAPNDEMASAQPTPMNSFGVCTTTLGTLLGATPSGNGSAPCLTCNDVWYSFVATRPGVRVHCNTTQNNLVIELTDSAGDMIEAEDAQSTLGSEILNYGDLTVGETYFVRVINYDSSQGEGTFTLCINALNASQCNWGSGPYGLCALFKATYTAAMSYTFNLTSVTTGLSYSGTTSNGNTRIRLSEVEGLVWGDEYIVDIDANYFIQNGAGQMEWVTVQNETPCTVTVQEQPFTQLRDADSCPAIRFLGSTIRANEWICGADHFEWEFIRTDLIQAPFYVSSLGASRLLTLTSATGVVNGATYQVRVRPVTIFGEGEFGSARCLQVGAPSTPPPTMALSPEAEVWPLEERTTPVSIESGLQIFPNPITDGIVHIQFDVPQEGAVRLELRDMTGRLIHQQQGHQLGQLVQWELPTDMISGVYTLRIAAAGKQWHRNVVIEK